MRKLGDETILFLESFCFSGLLFALFAMLPLLL